MHIYKLVSAEIYVFVIAKPINLRKYIRFFLKCHNYVIKTYIYVTSIAFYVTKLIINEFYTESVICMLMVSTAL